MGNEISTVGGAVATAATSVAAGVTFGQVDALNNAVEECAKFTANKAEQTLVRHVAETAGSAVGVAATAVAAGVTLGQVDCLNDAVVATANHTAKSGAVAGEKLLNTANDLADGTPGIGHIKGAIHYAAGDRDGGDQAMKASSRTTGVILGGIAGAAGGPAGCVAGGIAGGAAMDGITTGVESAVKGEYIPSGSIKAWTDVANGASQGNPQAVIEGIVNGSITPVFDGLTGLTAGAGRAAKIKSGKAQAKIKLYLEDPSKANIDLFEALKLTEDVKTSGKMVQKTIEPKRPDGVTYNTKQMPKEGWAKDGSKVYRGDKKMLDPEIRKTVLRDGINPKEGSFGSDAFNHTTANGAGENFISTTKEFKQAKEWGTKTTGKKNIYRGSAVAEITVQNGVDINLAARLLTEEARFAGQLEVSVHGQIPSRLIKGILEMKENGKVVWHNNPSFRPPATTETFLVMVESKGKTPVILTVPNQKDESDEEE